MTIGGGKVVGQLGQGGQVGVLVGGMLGQVDGVVVGHD